MSGTESDMNATLGGAELIRELGLRAVLAEDFKTHGRDITLPGLHTLFIYRIGTWSRTLRRPMRWVASLIYRLGFQFCRNVYGIELRQTVTIGRRFQIGHQSGIIIHRFATFGDDCIVRQGVTLGIANEERWVKGMGPVIGNNVSFAPGAIVIGNVCIGDNVQIGPNCVVTNDIPSDRILFMGSPRVLPRELPRELQKTA